MENWIAQWQLDAVETAEVSEEFTLPDYQSAIQRVCGVCGGVTTDSLYVENGTLEVNGCVLYTLYYTDEAGVLTSVPLVSRYSARFSAGEGDAGEVRSDRVWVRCELAENPVCRVSAPRKCTLSARVRVKCASLSPVDCSLPEAPGEEKTGGAVWKTETVPAVSLSSVRYTDSVEGECREAAGVQVVGCQGDVRVQDARGGAGGIRVLGEAEAVILLRTPEGEYRTVHSRAPLDAAVSREEAGGEITATATCASLEVNCAEDGQITWKMEYDIDATQWRASQAEVACDGYRIGMGDGAESCVYAQTQAVSLARCVHGRLTASGEKALRDDKRQMLTAWGRGSFDSVAPAPSGDRLVCTGTISLTFLTCGVDGEITAEECTVPVKTTCDGMTERDAGVVKGMCRLKVGEISAHREEGRLCWTAEVYMEGPILREETCRRAVQLRDGEPMAAAKPRILVYTPAAGESAWDVQKAYRICPSKMREAEGGRWILRL